MDVDFILLLLILGVVLLLIASHVKKSDKKERNTYDYKTHADFKKYYDTTQKRNIWVLGYFGGGATPISKAEIIAKEYAKEYNVPYESVVVDEIFNSRRFKGFKYMYSTKHQLPDGDADFSENVYRWLTD